MNFKKAFSALAIVAAVAVGSSACSSDADVASRNLSQEADDFKIDRRVVLYNGITDTYTLAIVGKCSLGNDDTKEQSSVTCKTEDGKYLKHIFRMGDNMTVFAQQLLPAEVSTARYKVYFKPEAIIPDIAKR